jgi:hypothetical protein
MVKKPDSVTHHEERHAHMRDEAAAQQAMANEAEEKREAATVEREGYIREAEDQELTKQAGLMQHGETREMLLDRVRKMREEKPKEEERPVFRVESLQKEAEAEQEEGRKTLARIAAEMEKNREIGRKQEEEDRAKKKDPGMTETVHHPNPSQDQVFPTSKPR